MRVALLPALRDNLADRSFPPLGLAMLAAYLKKREPSTSVAVFTSAREAAAFSPDLVGISSVTEHFTRARRLAGELRAACGAPILVGGVHITALPECLTDEFDAAVLGEGEETLLEIVRSGDLAAVPGLAMRRRGELVLTGERAPMAAGSIASPDRELIDREFPPGPEMHLLSSRGCTHRCSFCSSTRHWKSFRARPAAAVIGEMEDLLEQYAPLSLKFFDDLFIADRARLSEMHRLVLSKGLETRSVLSGYVRAGDFDEPACRMMREMGFRIVQFGAESASQAVLARLKGPGARVEDNDRLLDLCERYGLAPSASFIVGTPGETEKDLEATRAFIARNAERFFDVQVFPLVPYPGTAYWRLAMRRGVVSPSEEDWGRFGIILDEMDPATFPYLNDAMPYGRFLTWVEELKALSLSIKPYPERIARLLGTQTDFRIRRVSDTSGSEAGKFPRLCGDRSDEPIFRSFDSDEKSPPALDKSRPMP